jgi:hypothetical protein
MKKELGALAGLLLLAGCGRNEPGTMGGEPGVPPSQATGAPGEAAKHSTVADRDASAIKSEQGQSTFDRGETNSPSGLAAPDASTKSAEAR